MSSVQIGVCSSGYHRLNHGDQKVFGLGGIGVKETGKLILPPFPVGSGLKELTNFSFTRKTKLKKQNTCLKELGPIYV